MKLFGKTVSFVQHALDARVQRHKILSSNIANVDTPGYKPKDLDSSNATRNAFAMAQMEEAMERNARHRGGVEHRMVIERAGSSNGYDPMERAVVDLKGQDPDLDGNSVDLGHTMAALAENGIEYDALTKVVRKKMGLIKYAISGGGGH